MAVVDSLRELIARLEETEGTLSALEQRAGDLAQRYAAYARRRDALTRQVEAQEQAAAAAAMARRELMAEWQQATFNADTRAQKDVQARRDALDAAIAEAEQALARLTGELAGLDDLQDARVEVARALADLDVPYGWGIGTDLRNQLMRLQTELSGRRQRAEQTAPSPDYAVA